MLSRIALLFTCLLLASCTSSATEIVGPVATPATATPEPATPEPATPAPPTSEPATPEPATPAPPTSEPATSSAPFEELVALLADSDFQIDSVEAECLSAGLPTRLSADQVTEVLARSGENLEAGDPLTDSVVAVYEEIGVCLGGERLLDVLLEPEFDPETHTCVVAAFPDEQDQINAMVALMTIELADLPEPPGRYKAILDELTTACG